MKLISPTEVEVIVKTLLNGCLVAFPTETVYGLGADADNEEAINKIFSAKNRPVDHPLIVHVSDSRKIEYWGKKILPYVYKLINEFWPGPLTLIINSSNYVKPLINANQDSVAIRMPSNLIAKTILNEFENNGGNGVVAPSANLFGKVSTTTATSVYEELNDRLDDSHLIVDGGSCEFGLESTILDCRTEMPRVLRPGPISEKRILRFLGLDEVGILRNDFVKYSGMHAKHYSPTVKVVFNENPTAGDGLIALRDYKTPQGVQRISAPVDSKMLAHELYEAFRRGDKLGVKRIVVLIPNGTELEVAIMDRVKRAADNYNPQDNGLNLESGI